ncbi:hypothetical protein NDU88_001836 [Pleurodeles waltl]|uniref:Uncharacterized protein n=1 Tax=Pleurodeles waltl TaxID=8319 RepID=A0AAV7RE51_PLEWA|nr:hypothetical protein NDU88_001836 [Pleurodeles waltl]
MTPDFRVPGSLRSEDGLQARSEDPEAENPDAEDTGAENSTERKKEERRPGNTAVSWDAEESEDPEQSEDKLGSRHVPGGALLSKDLGMKRIGHKASLCPLLYWRRLWTTPELESFTAALQVI